MEVHSWLEHSADPVFEERRLKDIGDTRADAEVAGRACRSKMVQSPGTRGRHRQRRSGANGRELRRDDLLPTVHHQEERHRGGGSAEERSPSLIGRNGFDLLAPRRGKEHVIAWTDIKAIEAPDAPVEVDRPFLPIDASTLARFLAESAACTVPVVDRNLQHRKPRKEPEECPDRTENVAVESAPGIREPADNAQGSHAEKNGRNALRGRSTGLTQ